MTETAPRFRTAWTPWHTAAAAVLTALGAVATSDAWGDVARLGWRDEESSHVLLVPIVVAWLVWVRRRRLRHCRIRAAWVGPLVVAVGWFMYHHGQLHLYQSVWHAGAVVLTVGCLLTVTGVDPLRQLLPAFVALGFLIPIPGLVRQQVAVPLEGVATQATASVFELIGVAVERRGNVLVMNDVPVQIAEACNGLRMVFTVTLVSYLFAFGTPLRGYVRVLILAASPLSAVVCNVVRLVPTVWIYGNYPAAVADAFHQAGGWVMLVVSFLALVAIVRLLRWALIPVTQFTLAYD